MEYNQLKASIAAVIKTNNRKEITGQLLQNVLFQMTNVIGENLQLAGFATPLTDPHEPDQNLFYVTDQGGVYPHFDNLTVDDGLTFLMWKNGEWTSHTVGVVTQEWVDSHYVSIDFFRSLFRAYDSAGLEILPNNNPEDALPTVVDNIKAMVGFWTEQYISALGQQTGGGGGGGASTLDELNDVYLTNPTNGQALVYDAVSGKWVNQTIQAGTDMQTVWSSLAGATSQQINISHLTDALATYATQSWVSQNFITVAYFDRLFRAYNGNTLVSHNDVTSTIDNIKAMFGFWTEQYLSALGNNSGGGGQLLALSNMADVTLTTPSAGQVLTFDAVSGKWVNGAGVTTLANLTDVTLTSLANEQALIYNSVSGKWENTTLKTINGQHIVGSGDISVGGGASGNYLPLTGGTLTGALNIDSSADLYFWDGSNPRTYFGYDTPAGMTWLYDINSQQSIRLYSTGNLILWSNHVLCGLYTSTSYNLEVAGDTASDRFIVKSGTDNAFVSYQNGFYQFTSGGSLRCYIGMDAESNLFHIYTPSCQFRINYNNAGNAMINCGVNDVLTVASSATYSFIDFMNNGESKGWIGYTPNNTLTIAATNFNLNVSRNNGYVGIQTTSPSYELHVAGSIYATGAITALSDARKKDITGEAGVTVEQIAHAPAVQFLWKDEERRKDGQQVGTLAQYWRTVLPEVVMDKGGELSMQYGVTALVSAIVTARKVVDHERRIQELEKENERLKKEISQLRLN